MSSNNIAYENKEIRCAMKTFDKMVKSTGYTLHKENFDQYDKNLLNDRDFIENCFRKIIDQNFTYVSMDINERTSNLKDYLVELSVRAMLKGELPEKYNYFKSIYVKENEI